MTTINKYTISVPREKKIQRLKQNLSLSNYPDELEGAGWDYGAQMSDVQLITEYWLKQYRWEDTERSLNRLPNYMAEIEVDGFGVLDMHFLHQRSEVRDAVPLVFVHGWPGSFLEVTKLLPLLSGTRDGKDPAFHIVAPSLPNFGFSSGVKKRGFGPKQYAETCHKLMLALGYDQYVSQGGDWGSTITRVIGQLYPTHLRASHLNLVPSRPPSITSPVSYISFLVCHFLGLYSPAEAAGLQRTQETQKTGMGYYALQITKPQTIGYALSDSPVGLLAWMYEKLHDWTDGYDWEPDEICAWVSLYWFSTAGPAASVRIYYESLRGEIIAKAGGYVPGVKLGLAYSPREIIRLPKAWGYTLGEVVYVREHEQGGHFAAWERPERIAGDLKRMFGRGGGAFNAIENASGY